MADKTSELRMNLAAIKRVDPYAKDIIDNSAHVAFYTFNPDETEWEKTDIEGAFFVYSRNAEPYHSVFINNRLNTNSLVEPITAGIELQNQTPFLLYRNERNRIRGFWFYNRNECDRISELVERIAKDAEPLTESQKSGESNLPTQAFDLMTYSNNNVDIFSMLSRAQQDFNTSLTASKTKAVPPSPDAPKVMVNESIEKKSALQKVAPAAAPIQIPVNSSVMNFFAAAKPAQAQLKEGSGPLLQRMLSQPVHIDQIEQRVKTPLKEKQSPPQNRSTSSNAKPKQIPFGSVANIENGLSFVRINSPTQQQNASIDLGTSPLATFIASNNLAHFKGPLPTDVKEIESQRQKTDPQLQALLKKPVPVSSTPKPGGSQSSNTTPGKPAATKLMPPTMFETTANEANNQRVGPQNANAKAGKNESNETNKKNSMAKSKDVGNPKSRKKSAHEQQQQQPHTQAQQTDDLAAAVQPLTETQLLQAISYLMKNDPSFIRKIHEAYLKSFAEMVSQ
ncbi:mRNA-decapping enzyme 1A [Contarinia nasturtii]|uniref:mRNA-decapping enzyme 1A n=1 Tax=Contarinia nasturtii TaxID=265458 RepID=UPI0012D4205D|nr:mRNA-decapping enzyme 1A [Contarinia nasturtii]